MHNCRRQKKLNNFQHTDVCDIPWWFSLLDETLFSGDDTTALDISALIAFLLSCSEEEEWKKRSALLLTFNVFAQL